MSAVRSLSGKKRTFRGHRVSVANDPLRDMGNIQLTCILKPVSARVKKHQRITSQSADAFEAG
jgi:hypothetical protein